jgi:hypothetical protein
MFDQSLKYYFFKGIFFCFDFVKKHVDEVWRWSFYQSERHMKDVVMISFSDNLLDYATNKLENMSKEQREYIDLLRKKAREEFSKDFKENGIEVRNGSW